MNLTHEFFYNYNGSVVLESASFVDALPSQVAEEVFVRSWISRLPIFFLPFLTIWYIASLNQKPRYEIDVGDRKEPKMAPYWIPWVGHTLEFYLSKVNFAEKIRKMNSGGDPVKLRFGNYKVNLVSGFKHINAVWQSPLLETKPIAMLTLSAFFQSPRSAYGLWARDTSGGRSKPNPKSHTPASDRIFYHTHKTSHKFMAGVPLKNFARQFQRFYQSDLTMLPFSVEWTTMPDLYNFVQTSLSTAAVTALCGPSLLALNPGFIDDFWVFDGALPKFFGGLPQLTSPEGLKARQRCLDGIKRWQAYARENFDENSIGVDGHDPFWGTPLMRARQKFWSTMPAMDIDGQASEDLGIMWGENTNSIPGAFWCLAHVIKDPVLLERVRAECRKCIIDPTSEPAQFDADQICRNPLLQSIWSEAMRMYVAIFVVRAAENDEVLLDEEYVIGKGEFVAIDVWTAHHDRTVWNEGTPDNQHSVYDFWADRFLTYKDDPSSGPLKNSTWENRVVDSTDDSPQYCTTGLAGAWMPFGGGYQTCPGRRFAKTSMLLCLSMMVTLFDIELDADVQFTPNMNYYGMGALPLQGSAPFRIRRRERVDQ